MKNYLITFVTKVGDHTTVYDTAKDIKTVIRQQDYLIKKTGWEIVLVELKESIKNEKI